MIRLEVRGELRASKFLIIRRVFLQMYVSFLEIKFLLMIVGNLSE